MSGYPVRLGSSTCRTFALSQLLPEVACLHTRSNRLVGGRRKLRTSTTQLHHPDKRGKWRPFRFQPIVVDSRLNDLLDSKLPEPVALPTLSTLAAGETVTVREHQMTRVQKIADEDMARKLAWTRGRLWFDRVTLAEAVAEFNRYNHRQLVIEDPAIAGLHISGTFDATDTDSFVEALKTFGIHALPTAGKADDHNPETIRLVGRETAH